MRFGDFAARIYCNADHREINRIIENRPTRELIKRIFPADAELLDRTDQVRLAAWAAKTCYAQWGMIRRRRGVPIAHRRHLIRPAEPHPSVFVSISRCDGDRVRVIFARNEIVDGTDGSVSYSYDFVLALGQVAFKVWGPTDARRRELYKEPTSFATRIWPITSEIARWPPGRRLTDDGVTELWDYDPRAGKSSKER